MAAWQPLFEMQCREHTGLLEPVTKIRNRLYKALEIFKVSHFPFYKFKAKIKALRLLKLLIR